MWDEIKEGTLVNLSRCRYITKYFDMQIGYAIRYCMSTDSYLTKTFRSEEERDNHYTYLKGVIK